MPRQSFHPVETRRDRRIARKRSEIIEAAGRIFAQKGYANTTTKDIAEAVDMGESTLYGYFPGKRDILLAIIDQQKESMDEFLNQIERIETHDTLVELIERAVELWTMHTYFSRTVLVEALTDPEIFEFVGERQRRVAELIQGYLERHMRSGEFRAMDTQLAARMILSLFFGLTLPSILGTERPPSPEKRRAYAEAMAGLMIHGLLPDGNSWKGGSRL